MSDRELPPAADLIEVKRYGDRIEILVDGKPLPFPVSPEGVQMFIGPGLHPGINLTLVARETRVHDCLDDRKSPEAKAALRSKIDALSPPGTPRP